MIGNFKFFFRGVPDGYVFKIFSLTHLFILGFTLLGIFTIVKNRDVIRSNEKSMKGWKTVLISLILMQQGILYLWYIFSGYFSIQESLPLYNCRVAMISIAFGLLLNNRTLKYIGCYWGILGGIVALTMVNLDPFRFPHYTFVSYFLGHIVLLWSLVFIIIIEQMEFNRSTLKKIIVITNVYNVFILLFNLLTGSNYCYLVESPFFTEKIFSLVGHVGYSIIMFALFNLVVALAHLLIKSKVVTRFVDGPYVDVGGSIKTGIETK